MNIRSPLGVALAALIVVVGFAIGGWLAIATRPNQTQTVAVSTKNSAPTPPGAKAPLPTATRIVAAARTERPLPIQKLTPTATPAAVRAAVATVVPTAVPTVLATAQAANATSTQAAGKLADRRSERPRRHDRVGRISVLSRQYDRARPAQGERRGTPSRTVRTADQLACGIPGRRSAADGTVSRSQLPGRRIERRSPRHTILTGRPNLQRHLLARRRKARRFRRPSTVIAVANATKLQPVLA